MAYFEKVVINVPNGESIGGNALQRIGFMGNSSSKAPKFGRNSEARGKYNEMADTMKNCGQPLSVQYIYDGVNYTTLISPDNNWTVTLHAFQGSLPTFKLLGMDITEDLDVVVKGKYSMIYVANMRDINEKSFYWGRYRNIIESDRDIIIKAGFDRDGMSSFIENIKFADYDINNVNILRDSLKEALTDMVKGATVPSDSGSAFSSIIINYIKGNSVFSNSFEAPMSEVLKIYTDILCKMMKDITQKYGIISYMLKILERYLDSYSDLYGKDRAIEAVRAGVVEGGINTVGCFEGFIREHLEEDMAINNISENFTTNILPKIINPEHINEPKIKVNSFGEYDPTADLELVNYEDLGVTMFPIPSSANIDEATSEDLMSYSVLDYMKYADVDLTLDPVALDDLATDEGKERLLNTVINTFNKKMRHLYKDPLTVSDAVIKNAIPDKVDSGIDILNINTDFRTDGYGETEISRISFNRTNLMKATRLLAKVLQRFNKIDKANSKTASHS